MNEIITLSEDIDTKINASEAVVVGLPEECNSVFSQAQQQICMKILQQNIRSLNHNFDDMLVILERLSLDIDFVILTECWLSKVTNIPQLENYHSYATLNNLNQNDGVVLYVKKKIQCKVEELKLSEASGLLMTKGQDFAVLCIYRPPSFTNIDRFLESLNIILTELKQYKNVIIMGDINVDIAPENNDKRSDDYLLLLASHGLATTNSHKNLSGSQFC